MKLLIITQKVDQNDGVLGFFHGWIVAFSQRCEQLTVICLEKGKDDLPDSVRVASLGKEERKSRWQYITNFYYYLWKYRHQYDAVFVHMNQEYVLLAGLWWRLTGKKIMLWRNHPEGNWLTHIAVRLAHQVFCTSEFSYTAQFSKTTIMPVGIDTEVFRRIEAVERKSQSILVFGRISPVKKIETFIEACHILKKEGVFFHAAIVGDALLVHEKYYQDLKLRVQGLEGMLEFKSGIPNSQATHLYSQYELYVNLTPTGSFDKTTLEAMATEMIVIASNQSLLELLGESFIFQQDDPQSLAVCIKKALSIDSHSRLEIGKNARNKIKESHELRSLTNKLFVVAEGLVHSKQTKVLYLFNGRPRIDVINDIKSGRTHDGSIYGMFRMAQYGIIVDYVELEKIFSPRLASWLRKNVLNVYFDHIPFLFTFFKYDIVFSTTAFGSQFLRALIPVRRPLWMMFGFSISGLLGKERTIRQKLFKWMVGRATVIMTIADKEANILKGRFPHLKNHIISVLYPVDTHFFAPLDVPQEHQILTVGFDPGRDYKTFFEACKNFNVKIIVAARVGRLKSFMPLPNRVHVESYQPLDLLREYAKAKVVVIPLNTQGGLNDAMGCSTLVEAMAMGKAIVATRTPTMESFIIDGDNGFLVEEGNQEAMRHAIETLLHDEQLRKAFGDKARKFVVENCDTEIFTQRLANLFKKINH